MEVWWCACLPDPFFGQHVRPRSFHSTHCVPCDASVDVTELHVLGTCSKHHAECTDKVGLDLIKLYGTAQYGMVWHGRPDARSVCACVCVRVCVCVCVYVRMCVCVCVCMCVSM